MKLMKSLRLALMSIGLAGGVASVAVLAQALVSFNALDGSAQKAMVAKDVVADILPPPMYLIEMRLVLSQAVEQTLPHDRAAAEFDRLGKEYQARVEHWTARPPYGLEKQLLGEQHTAGRAFMAAAKTEVLDKLAGGDTAGAQEGLKQVNALYMKHRSGVDRTVEAGNQLAVDSMTSFVASREAGIRMMAIVTLTLLVVTLSMYLWARRSILVPLNACVDQANAVATGNLSSKIECDRGDEIGKLQQALGEMTGQLSRMVGEMRSGIDEIATASSDIARGNNDLSMRTEQQAASLEQTASSMEEIAATVRSSADHSVRASDLATGASKVATTGGQALGNMIATMDQIRDSSIQIANIIGVIDGIAFQTNILALNAAVEAARAGEQGRGFAVVASEVRALATRSAAAAKEIKGLISSSGDKVEAGHRLATEAGQTIDQVVKQVREVTQLIAQISTASLEQNNGVGQINQAVNHLQSTTQQNAALVEQTAAASESLHQQAARLASAVSVFRLEAA
jgi:methyl-accepting chemotaxis protein